MTRRGRTEILWCILYVALGGIQKSHIMALANISFKQMQRTLPHLQERGLLEEIHVEGKRQFITTPQGRKTLKAGDELFALLGYKIEFISTPLNFEAVTISIPEKEEK